ncbi:MAG: RcpC/CpaB family pilus assembly protein [Acidimicrobiia bacterium]|nr:RcpC/CpaB family pilus assembly protein [Acidimicrobiia bacterium]MDH5291928.1 RcpC/CpaB family pilus assembly protein [Acidimicrobiia bacterium]
MSRRVTGFAVAVLLALVGTAALVVYVKGAERRALAGEELVEVYVVRAPIPSGTAAEDITGLVSVERVPIKVHASGAVTSLPALTGQVAAVDLVPGEQLVAGRFVQRSQFTDRQAGVDVPEDMVEVTVELDPQRAVGGLLEAGQTVAVLASFDPLGQSETVVNVDGKTVPVPAAAVDRLGGETANSTDLLLRKVLVTAVQEPAAEASVDQAQRLTTAPGETIFVTLAVHPFDAERLVFTAEFGNIWLAVERPTVPEADEPGQTRGSVLLDKVGAQ